MSYFAPNHRNYTAVLLEYICCSSGEGSASSTQTEDATLVIQDITMKGLGPDFAVIWSDSSAVGSLKRKKVKLLNCSPCKEFQMGRVYFLMLWSGHLTWEYKYLPFPHFHNTQCFTQILD